MKQKNRLIPKYYPQCLNYVYHVLNFGLATVRLLLVFYMKRTENTPTRIPLSIISMIYAPHHSSQPLRFSQVL
ncbi:hypothetical protein Pr1d_06230 [Bythopirellula goksoeyrii]|uniref:Uncharacterized protein n=1 Tax=Bythopirellula goksoeyrii TaxID=1400387 RepID=A0A5B9Q7G2_9BACT|nr:hypothetical protein Pr1d_06230 [Bythopirellula goksoeyrii]